MTDTTASRKAKLRKLIRSRLKTLSGPELQDKSRRIAENLLTTPWWEEAEWVFAYIAVPEEVETREIIVRAYRQQKQVAIPRMEGHKLTFYRYDGRTHELLPNQFGILEPDPRWVAVDPCRVAAERPDMPGGRPLLVLAPGVGFDRNRRRLGRGKGYYDRLLSAVRCADVRLSVVGVAYSEQLVDEIPVHDHDQPLDGVVTDREVIA
jgi:5-formyltetrahydrofolate cyclo-ligase